MQTENQDKDPERKHVRHVVSQIDVCDVISLCTTRAVLIQVFLLVARPSCYVVNELLYIRNKFCLNQTINPNTRTRTTEGCFSVSVCLFSFLFFFFFSFFFLLFLTVKRRRQPRKDPQQYICDPVPSHSKHRFRVPFFPNPPF